MSRILSSFIILGACLFSNFTFGELGSEIKTDCNFREMTIMTTQMNCQNPNGRCLRGRRGLPGPRGATGPAGPAGPTGATGATGPTTFITDTGQTLRFIFEADVDLNGNVGMLTLVPYITAPNGQFFVYPPIDASGGGTFVTDQTITNPVGGTYHVGYFVSAFNQPGTQIAFRDAAVFASRYPMVNPINLQNVPSNLTIPHAGEFNTQDTLIFSYVFF